MVAAKNIALTPAASADLGLGDQLKQQLEDAETERKKKLAQQAGPTGANATAIMGPATQQLFGGTR